MKTKKRDWKNFEILKVRLNPEQAVLSCCVLGEKGMIGEDQQCRAGCGGTNDPVGTST